MKINVFTSKSVRAFYEKCTLVQVVDVGFEPKIDNKYILFEKEGNILFKSDDGVFVENIIIDKSNKQRFIVSEIEQQQVLYEVSINDKKDKEVITCKRALIKKYNPL